MSLKIFHFAFVVFSVLVTAMFGWWSLTTGVGVLPGAEIYGLGSLFSSVVLFGYLIWVARKLRNFGFLTLVPALFFMASSDAYACAVCYGNPSSPLVKGASAGIFVLMGFIAFILSAFGGLFLFWRHRSRLQSTLH